MVWMPIEHLRGASCCVCCDKCRARRRYRPSSWESTFPARSIGISRGSLVPLWVPRLAINKETGSTCDHIGNLGLMVSCCGTASTMRSFARRGRAPHGHSILSRLEQVQSHWNRVSLSRRSSRACPSWFMVSHGQRFDWTADPRR